MVQIISNKRRSTAPIIDKRIAAFFLGIVALLIYSVAQSQSDAVGLGELLLDGDDDGHEDTLTTAVARSSASKVSHERHEHSAGHGIDDTDGVPVEEQEPNQQEEEEEDTEEQDTNDSSSLCNGYDGILFISHVIRKAGAGTLFFQSLVDSLLYAELYNLYPFLWVNDDKNQPCYDPNVHGVGPNITFQHLTGPITNLIGEGDMVCHTKSNTRPGPPDFENLVMKDYTLVGNGLWQSYFRPISQQGFPFEACPNHPIFEMTNSQVMPDMHRCSEFAVRGWTFFGIPDRLLPQEGQQSMQDWLWENNRKHASRIVERYYRPQQWLQRKIQDANPVQDKQCLAMHVRLTDKASGRDKKGLEAYLPYAEAFSKAAPKTPIYVATDDSRVIQQLRGALPSSTPILSQNGVLRSSSNVPTFKLLAEDKHRSNTEALVEIYAMAKCGFFVHGFSGMAEAVVYIEPFLHKRSVNIDDPDEPVSPINFEMMVQRVLELEAQYQPSDGEGRSAA